MTTRREWYISLWFVIALTMGAIVMRYVVNGLSNYVMRDNTLISNSEGAVIQAIEMIIITIFGLIGFAIPLKINIKEIISLGWKVALISAIIGVVIGWTYTAGLQNITCGFLHSMHIY